MVYIFGVDIPILEFLFFLNVIMLGYNNPDHVMGTKKS
jgi:hypothetical protein